MVEKVIRGGICIAVHRYEKANNKYMQNYDKDNESSFLEFSDVNYLYGWAISQNLPVDGFKWIETSLINKKINKFIKLVKNYDEKSDEGFILEVDIEYPKNLHNLQSDLPFLPERIKTNKCSNRLCNLYDIKIINSTHFFIMKIPNKKELQQIALNHSSDIDFKNFIKIYKKCTAEPTTKLYHLIIL